jgi:hypothetical protein
MERLECPFVPIRTPYLGFFFDFFGMFQKHIKVVNTF